MRKPQFIFFLVFTFAFLMFLKFSTAANATGTVAEPQAPAKISPDAQERAKKLYGFDCSFCHGEKGDGKGDMAGDFGNKIKDWTNPDTLKGFTDDQLFAIIKDGKGDMPPEGKRAKTDEMWAMVAMIRSFAKK